MGKKKNNNNNQLQPTNNDIDNQETKFFVQSVLMRTITEEVYQNLKRENNDLQAKFLLITHNERLLQETINNAKILVAEKEQLKEENDKLRAENNILKYKINEIEDKNKILEEHINKQNKRITDLENDVKELKSRDDPITIREGFCSLEKYIIKEILGENFSNTKARKIHGITNLFEDVNYKNECEEFLRKHNLTEDHIFLIPDLKENGNKSAHERPSTTRKEFEDITLSYLIDNNDKMMAKDLLSYLESQNPYNKNTNEWIITKPF
jgi:hypothetical protein